MNKTCIMGKARHGDRTVIGMAGLLLVWCFLLTGCDRPHAGKDIPDSPYKVVDTGYWSAEVNSLAEPLWLDNERIIFTSTKELTPGKPPYRVKAFNVATGKVESTPFYTAFCVRDGIALFQEKDEASGKTTDYRGTLENYHKEPDPPSDMRFDSVFDCDWVPIENYNDKPLPHRRKLRGKNYLEVREKRTKLLEYEKRPRDRRREQETGDTGSEGKLIYHQNVNDDGRQVPFSVFAYSEFIDAYVVGRNYFDPKYAETRSFWILKRNGDLKEVPYPKDWLKGRNDIYPVKPGFLIHYTDGPITQTDHGDRGLYLMQGQQVRRLIIGTFGHVSISPDGCKAAIIHARNIKESLSILKPYRTIKYINFCKGEMQP